MLGVISRVVVFAAVAGTIASCSPEDPQPSVRAQRCEQISRAACAVLVRCRALTGDGGRIFSDELCDQALPRVAGDCATKPENAAVETASDGEISACVSAYRAFPCSELCGKLAVDPQACQEFDTAPSQNVIECAP
jgi:hypothetical protein